MAYFGFVTIFITKLNNKNKNFNFLLTISSWPTSGSASTGSTWSVVSQLVIGLDQILRLTQTIKWVALLSDIKRIICGAVLTGKWICKNTRWSHYNILLYISFFTFLIIVNYKKYFIFLWKKDKMYYEPSLGIEPRTFTLQVWCTTTMQKRLLMIHILCYTPQILITKSL